MKNATIGAIAVVSAAIIGGVATGFTREFTRPWAVSFHDLVHQKRAEAAKAEVKEEKP